MRRRNFRISNTDNSRSYLDDSDHSYVGTGHEKNLTSLKKRCQIVFFTYQFHFLGLSLRSELEDGYPKVLDDSAVRDVSTGRDRSYIAKKALSDGVFYRSDLEDGILMTAL